MQDASPPADLVPPVIGSAVTREHDTRRYFCPAMAARLSCARKEQREGDLKPWSVFFGRDTCQKHIRKLQLVFNVWPVGYAWPSSAIRHCCSFNIHTNVCTLRLCVDIAWTLQQVTKYNYTEQLQLQLNRQSTLLGTFTHFDGSLNIIDTRLSMTLSQRAANLEFLAPSNIKVFSCFLINVLIYAYNIIILSSTYYKFMLWI